VDNKAESKAFIINDKTSIIAQLYAHIGTHAKLVSQLRLSLFTLNTTVKHRQEIERCYTYCGPFFEHQKSLKRLLVQTFFK
jgi:hypothetical protein